MALVRKMLTAKQASLINCFWFYVLFNIPFCHKI